MIRSYLMLLVLFSFGVPLVGCSEEENRTIETQGELWDERAAFYANEDNFTDEEYVDEEEPEE
ncbi:hypothetical protein [Rhodopirellula sallentina]|nr:hypothetical protein [Rhodopirellula sallentina]